MNWVEIGHSEGASKMRMLFLGTKEEKHFFDLVIPAENLAEACLVKGETCQWWNWVRQFLSKALKHWRVVLASPDWLLSKVREKEDLEIKWLKMKQNLTFWKAHLFGKKWNCIWETSRVWLSNWKNNMDRSFKGMQNPMIQDSHREGVL